MAEKKEPTSRVTMLWPADLKEEVRKEVGGRGLTDFTLEAVRAKLGTHDAHKADSKELNEVKFLAQRLADRIAMSSDYEDPYATLQEIGLPDWIDVMGWPDKIAALVKPEDSTPEPVEPEPEPELITDHPYQPSYTGMVCEAMVMRDGSGDQCGLSIEQHAKAEAKEEDDEDLHRPMALVGRSSHSIHERDALKGEPGPAIGDPGTIRQDLPHDRQTGDLLARVRAKAEEKGVDLSGVDLKPASSVEQPPAKEYGHGREGDQCVPEVCGGTRHDPCTYSPEEVARFEAETQAELQALDGSTGITVETSDGVQEVEYEQDPVVAAQADPNTCPKCGSELVAGECWECM